MVGVWVCWQPPSCCGGWKQGGQGVVRGSGQLAARRTDGWCTEHPICDKRMQPPGSRQHGMHSWGNTCTVAAVPHTST